MLPDFFVLESNIFIRIFVFNLTYKNLHLLHWNIPPLHRPKGGISNNMP